MKILNILKWLPSPIWTACIVMLAVSPSPYKTAPFPGFDKVLHFGAFGLLALLTVLPSRKIPAWLSMIVLPASIGAIIELVQMHIPFRSADILDWLADLAGCTLAFVGYLVFERIRARREH